MNDAPPRRALPAIVGTVVAAGLLALAVRSLTVGQGQSYDTLLYARSLWGMAHGELWNPAYGTHAFGIHANVALYVLAPLVWLIPAAFVLAGAQAAAFGATVAVVGRAARSHAGTAMALALLAPLVVNPYLFDLRPGVLAVPLLTAGLLRMRARQQLDGRALALLVAATLVREEFAIIAAAGVALAPLGTQRIARRVGVAAAFVGYMALYWFVLRDAFAGAGAGERAARATADLFASADGAWAYRGQLALALALTGGGFVVAGWRWIGAAVPGIGLALLLAKQPEHALSFHYTMFAAPGLLVALVDGLEQRGDDRRLRAGALAMSAAATLAWGAAPGGARFQADAFGFDADARAWQAEVHALTASVPDEAGVVAPGPFAAMLADRPVVYSVETLTAAIQRDGAAPTDLDAAILATHDWDGLGRWLVNRGGFQLQGYVAGRMAVVVRLPDEADNPFVAADATPPPCEALTFVWPSVGLGACLLDDDASLAILRIAPRPAGARPLALERARDADVQPVSLEHGLLNPMQLPVERWRPASAPGGFAAGDVLRLVDDQGQIVPGLDLRRPDPAPAPVVTL